MTEHVKDSHSLTSRLWYVSDVVCGESRAHLRQAAAQAALGLNNEVLRSKHISVVEPSISRGTEKAHEVRQRTVRLGPIPEDVAEPLFRQELEQECGIPSTEIKRVDLIESGGKIEAHVQFVTEAVCMTGLLTRTFY